MKIEEMLENRHTTYLEWADSWLACGPEGNDLDACVYHQATVHDCINMSRMNAKKNHGASAKDLIGKDRDFLVDWMAIMWAYPAERKND